MLRGKCWWTESYVGVMRLRDEHTLRTRKARCMRHNEIRSTQTSARRAPAHDHGATPCTTHGLPSRLSVIRFLISFDVSARSNTRLRGPDPCTPSHPLEMNNGSGLCNDGRGRSVQHRTYRPIVECESRADCARPYSELHCALVCSIAPDRRRHARAVLFIQCHEHIWRVLCAGGS